MFTNRTETNWDSGQTEKLEWSATENYKKCSDISEVTSGVRAEIGNMKNDRPSDLQLHLRQQMLLLKCYRTFYIYGALGKKRFLSDF